MRRGGVARPGGFGRAAGTDCRIRFGVDAAADAGAARGRGALPYPDGRSRLHALHVINEYNTVGNRIKPPFTSIVKYDLNSPAIKWRIGFGDDPALAARGITGTGAPALHNGIIVTESGLVFGAGRDNQIRAWDSDTGQAALVVALRRQLRRLAGDVRDGRQAVSAGARRQHEGRPRRRHRTGRGCAARLGSLRAAVEITLTQKNGGNPVSGIAAIF